MVDDTALRPERIIVPGADRSSRERRDSLEACHDEQG